MPGRALGCGGVPAPMVMDNDEFYSVRVRSPKAKNQEKQNSVERWFLAQVKAMGGS